LTLTHRRCDVKQTRIRSLWILVLPVVAAIVLGHAPGEEVLAQVPVDAPVFSDPLDFDNGFFPVEEGGMRVYTGKSDGEYTAVVDTILADTRDFDWGGGTVTCAILVETEFEGGALSEISFNYFAQADDGCVYYFGEVVDIYEDGEVVDHEGSWLVGGPGPDDPAETVTADDPALFMPADPEVGDTWKPEDVPGGPEEVAEVVREDRSVKVPAGMFEGCLQVEELNVADGDKGTKWYAPGIGMVLDRSSNEKLVLVATTFVADDED
jgi:hypothetical protein